MLRICMIGTGYVGLVSGACLADFGNTVRCVDINEKRISMLNEGEIPIYEPGLKDFVHRNKDGGRLLFTTNLEEAVKASDVVFIAVGTPSKEDGSTDLSYIFKAAEDLAQYIDGYKVIVQKSTVPVGTTREIGKRIRELASKDASFDIVSNPEFLREGSAIEDFMRPDRVVIGVDSEKAKEIMAKVYRPLYLIETPIVFTNLETGELIKYASNAYLATKISFINEIAAICEHVGADVDDVAKGMGLDRRIGNKFLHAGIGYGGSCLPKDVSSLIYFSKEEGYDPRILMAVHDLNKLQVTRAMQKIQEFVGPLEGKTIGVLGLSFKPNTDDLREAPTIRMIEELLAHKAIVKVFDPIAMDNCKEQKDLAMEYCKNPYDVAEDCHALILGTEWNEFRELDLKRLKSLMNEPIFIDCRNVYRPKIMEEQGFRYQSFGRGIKQRS